MNKVKKETIIVSIILAILVLFIASVITFVVYATNDKNVLYQCSEQQYNLGVLAWDTFKIYDNGLVITNEYYEEDKFKISKISKEEVGELKALIDTIEDNKKDIENPESKLGDRIKSIYSERLSEDIILYREGEYFNYINTSENCEEILELVQEIYERHKQ